MGIMRAASEERKRLVMFMLLGTLLERVYCTQNMRRDAGLVER